MTLFKKVFGSHAVGDQELLQVDYEYQARRTALQCGIKVKVISEYLFRNCMRNRSTSVGQQECVGTRI